MTLGEKITDLRKKRGLSQEELAITLGVSRQAVSKWELGDAMPDTDKVIALADYFDVTTDWLLRDIQPSSPGSETNPIPSVTEMLRGAPILLNLTIGGNVFGAALMIYDLWQQTYYQIPTILGLFVQIGMCALFLGLCSSIQTQDVSTGRQWRKKYWQCNIYALALMPSFWVSNIALDMLAQRFPVSSLLLLPMTAMVYFLVCLRMHFTTREMQ
nr:helix-turn-helix transcriptional regulator [uncultured Agathobaculum sp.]